MSGLRCVQHAPECMHLHLVLPLAPQKPGEVRSRTNLSCWGSREGCIGQLVQHIEASTRMQSPGRAQASCREWRHVRLRCVQRAPQRVHPQLGRRREAEVRALQPCIGSGFSCSQLHHSCWLEPLAVSPAINGLEPWSMATSLPAAEIPECLTFTGKPDKSSSW